MVEIAHFESIFFLSQKSYLKEGQEITWQLFHCVYQTTAIGMRHPGISNVTKANLARDFSW